MKYKIIVIVIFTLLFSMLSSDFREMNRGTRALGMGNAFSAISGTPESIYFNPASLSDISNYNLNLSTQNVYGIAYLLNLNLAAVAPVKSYTLAFAVQQQNLLDVYAESIVYFGTARKFFRGNSCFKLGANAKYYMVSGDDVEVKFDQPYDLDLGFVWQRKGMALSYVSRDLLRFAGEKDQINSAQVLGAAINWQDLLNMTLDYEILSETSKLHIGIELWFYDTFAPRIGLDQEYLTMGFGLKANWWDFDFGLKAHEKLGTTYRFGFNLKYKGGSL